jgi:membrane-bound inhibitor of C-type lysozyme
MMRQIFGLVAAMIALIVVLPASGQGRKTIVYGCADGRGVTVTYGTGWADVVVGGRSSRLNAVPSSAGTRYSDGRWVWRLTGPTGALTRDGQVVARNCLARATTTMSAPQPAGSRTVRYACANGTRIQAVYRGNAAVVTASGRRYTMYQTKAASGVRYAGGGGVWWTKGQEGFLTTSDGRTIASSCRAL